MRETDVDPASPDPARVYDYLLGGKDWYPADEMAAETVMQAFPSARQAALSNRAFMHRAVRTLAADHGIRQYLDLGTGIPTRPNLHEVAQSQAPECRVVYTDNRRIVLLRAEALMRSTPQGRTGYLHADITEPATVLLDPVLGETIDLSRPVALSMCAILHYLTDDQNPADLIATYLDALAPGSALILSQATSDHLTDEQRHRFRQLGGRGVTGQAAQVRSRAEITAFFAGLDLLDPGVVTAHRWRPDGTSGDADCADADVALYAGVAIKP